MEANWVKREHETDQMSLMNTRDTSPAASGGREVLPAVVMG